MSAQLDVDLRALLGIVTNDQAADLVDTQALRSQGFGGSIKLRPFCDDSIFEA